MISAALFYGDAMITPALSVLSAVEGLKVATPALHSYVVPLVGGDPVRPVRGAVAGARRASHRSSARSLLVWFFALAAAGAWHMAQNPTVLGAFNPVTA